MFRALINYEYSSVPPEDLICFSAARSTELDLFIVSPDAEVENYSSCGRNNT